MLKSCIYKSLATRRGRGFMLTAAFGFLLEGPIDTIETNVQEVVRGITCMYQQVKESLHLYMSINSLNNLTEKFLSIYIAFKNLFTYFMKG